MNNHHIMFSGSGCYQQISIRAGCGLPGALCHSNLSYRLESWSDLSKAKGRRWQRPGSPEPWGPCFLAILVPVDLHSKGSLPGRLLNKAFHIYVNLILIQKDAPVFTIPIRVVRPDILPGFAFHNSFNKPNLGHHMTNHAFNFSRLQFSQHLEY